MQTFQRAEIVTMVLTRLKELRNRKDVAEQESSHVCILIVEDDPEQMALLADFAKVEIKKLIDAEHITAEKRKKLQDINLLKASNINSLEKAISNHKNILLAILDGNIPDSKDGKAHDQFVKTGYKITGQHRSVDIVTKHLPETPITMISSLNRFQKIVHQYYKNKHGVSINFIRKKDTPMIKRNIGFYLRQYLK